jgi:hypothetical protein
MKWRGRSASVVDPGFVRVFVPNDRVYRAAVAEREDNPAFGLTVAKGGIQRVERRCLEWPMPKTDAS